jgi:DNA-binding MurR/RpiR family transcriptional regulator
MHPMSVSAALVEVGDRLTPAERRVADALVADPTLLAFGTVSDLAERVGTSRPTIVRFATKLGFAGYPELQATARAGLSRQLSTPRERVRDRDATSRRDLHLLVESLRTLEQVVSSGALRDLATRVAKANAVWIASGETSMASAHALQSGLGIIHRNVHLLDEYSLGRDLVGAGPRDVAVISDFRRYRRSSITAAKALQRRSVPIVAITDSPLSPLAPYADALIELTIPAVGPFDSSVLTVALAELVVAEVALIDRSSVQERIDRTEELWEATATFVPDP